MTIGYLIKDKDYDYVSYRITWDGIRKQFGCNSVFAGAFSVENGKIVSLDCDTYSEHEEVVDWAEWSNPDKGIIRGLTVVVKVDMEDE
jgi:hypothetical protein